MVRRTTLDLIWETLDDPNSSKKAWWISQFQSFLVLATLIFGTIQTSETPIFTPTTVAIVETTFDSLPPDWNWETIFYPFLLRFSSWEVDGTWRSWEIFCR